MAQQLSQQWKDFVKTLATAQVNIIKGALTAVTVQLGIFNVKNAVKNAPLMIKQTIQQIAVNAAKSAVSTAKGMFTGITNVLKPPQLPGMPEPPNVPEINQNLKSFKKIIKKVTKPVDTLTNKLQSTSRAIASIGADTTANNNQITTAVNQIASC